MNETEYIENYKTQSDVTTLIIIKIYMYMYIIAYNFCCIVSHKSRKRIHGNNMHTMGGKRAR